MIWIKVQRVLKAGFVNFFRNGLVSLATVLIISVALFVIGWTILGRAILMHTLNQVQNKVDISIYFKDYASEEEILGMKDVITKLDEVDSADYISKEQALEEFKQRHSDNSLILQSLDELGKNPLGAVLNIKAKESSQYESIATFLKKEKETEGSIIDTTSYFKNKEVIDRLNKIIATSKTIGISLSAVLVVIAFLVSFNTIKLAIYTSREEIGVMRLVGASNRFIKGPFFIEGMICGIISTVITLTVIYFMVLWLGAKTESFFGGINLFRYYISNFFQITLIFLGASVILSAFSASIAVRRYLKV